MHEIDEVNQTVSEILSMLSQEGTQLKNSNGAPSGFIDSPIIPSDIKYNDPLKLIGES